MSKPSIAFIVNPRSGSAGKEILQDRIAAICGRWAVKYTIEETESPGHAAILAEALCESGFERIASVGGDGTVNEAARGVIKLGGVLSIIPAGSGNGLARHLGIPMQIEESINTALTGDIIQMDYGMIQDMPFLVTCGVGFDAEISHAFAQTQTRGLLGYVKEIIAAFPGYKAQNYTLELPDRIKKTNAFTITVANASQYGNRAVIAAGASVTDGLLDVCIIKKYPKIFGPQIGLRLFLSNLHDSSFYRRYRVATLNILVPENEKIKGQLDGEPVWLRSPVKIETVAAGIKVSVPKNRNL
jgi:YegS/Rv2252/BmrU family lipid kinase